MEQWMIYSKIDIKNLDKNRFELDVISYSLPQFNYNTLSTQIDENGEIEVHAIGNENTTVNSAMFLFWLRTYIGSPDEQKDVPFHYVESIDDVNAFLMDLLVNESNKDVSIYSRGLIHFFTQLVEWQMDWKEQPYTKSKRPLYRFKNFLEGSYRSSDPDAHIAASTAKAYMRAAVRFYKYHIAKGVQFANVPFEYEEISLDIGSDETSNNGSNRIIVPTTDVRLNVPKPQAGVIPNKLRALSDHEYDMLEQILCIKRKVLKKQYGQLVECSLPIEFSLIFLVMRHCGLRRNEALTLNEEWVLWGLAKSGNALFVRLKVGPNQGIETKNDKEREIEIPVPLLRQLHRYTLSQRYINRRDKFTDSATGDEFTPLFLNQNGSRIKKETVNARWSEIRHSLTEVLGYKFTHKVHNLRSTFGTKRLFSLIDVGMKTSIALETVQLLLGHSDLATTFHYLSQVDGHKSAEELAEIALDYIYDLNEMEVA